MSLKSELQEILAKNIHPALLEVLTPSEVLVIFKELAVATDQTLDLLDKSLPSHKRQVHVEHGEIMPSVAQCKWYFDGYEQAIADVRKVIKETSND
jgi:hypothetical protein